MSIQTQLDFELELSSSEKQIAKYILTNQEKVLNMSIKQLASNTYTSPATIVRLCKKMGLKGYNDFKIKYSAQLEHDKRNNNKVDANFPFIKTDNSEEIANKLSSLSIEVIKNTNQLVDYKVLDKIVELLDNTNNIDLYGLGNSILAGLSFQHKMMRIQKNINIKTIPGEQIFMAYNSNPNTVSIIISYSGETDEIIRYAKALKERKSTIIAITSIGDNKLSHIADYILYLDSREKIYTKIAPFSSTMSIEYLLNLIFSCLFQKNYEINKINKIIPDKKNDLRHPFSPINDEE